VGSDVRGASHVPSDEGRKLWVVDELMTFKATGEDTGGAYLLTDSVVPPRGGPPSHVHNREDEAFWVLEGELEVSVGEGSSRAGVGSFVHLPRGVVHSFQNSSDKPARFLTLVIPAGLEGFFEEVGKPGTDPSSPPSFGEQDPERLLAVAPRYGVEIHTPEQ